MKPAPPVIRYRKNPPLYVEGYVCSSEPEGNLEVLRYLRRTHSHTHTDNSDKSSSNPARLNHGIQHHAKNRHFTAASRSRVRVKASLGVSPLRTTSKTPSVSAERITASVAAITGGESITMNLKRRRNSAIASRMRWEESKSAGLGGTGPVVSAERLLIVGCGMISFIEVETPARYELSPHLFPTR